MTKIELYNPTDNPVFVGKGQHTALCTAWDDWEDLLPPAPSLEKTFAIIGTLRGPSGIAPLIRNLALNPEIGEIVIWTDGKHTSEAYGRTGLELLLALWSKGINNDGTIPGTPFQLEKQVPPAFVRRIISDVKLTFAKKKGRLVLPAEISSYASRGLKATDRKARSFREPPENKAKRWPSERISMHFRGTTIVEAWTNLIAAVMRYGTRKGSQHGQQCELLGVSWTIDGEAPEAIAFPADWPEALRLLTGTTDKQLAGYLPQILTPDREEGTYGRFLFAYPTSAGPLDQIKRAIIDGFRSSKDCRRGVATTLVPEKHAGATDPPCMDLVQCLQSDGLLHMMAYFRSHDIMKAALPNATALRHLQKKIADELGFAVGGLTILSASAHVYGVDWVQATNFIKCAFGQASGFGFRPQDADPRGNFRISISGRTIAIALISPSGKALWKYADEYPPVIAMKIAKLGLVADPRHLLYLGGELERARAAIKAGKPYVQL
jgi:thymidylate synthase (methanogen type)